MKKFVAVVMCLCICISSLGVCALGESVGNIYATDIVAYVKGAPITSYNIGGKTVIDAEILNWHYGFDVYWYEGDRHLDITDKGIEFVSLQAAAGDVLEKIDGNPGDKVGNFYKTDIVTTLNGKTIESYNIGGRTVIVAEEMAKCGYDVEWNEEKREIKVLFTSDTYAIDTDIGKVSTTKAGNLEKNLTDFYSMSAFRDGSFLIEGKEVVSDGKIYRNGWQNTCFVPLVKTLNAIGAKYDWNNDEKILTVTYDKNKVLELKEYEEKEWKTVAEPGKYVSAFPINFVVNGEEYSNKTGLHTNRFSSLRNTVPAYVLDGEVYVTSNTFADFMGYCCDDGVNFYLKVSSDFADKLNALMPTDKNYMFSPLGIKTALGLVLNGADGETKNEIVNALGISQADSFNEYNKKLFDEYKNDKTFELDIANAVFLNTDRTLGEFSDEYKSIVENFYNADSVRVSDKNAVKTINDWASENTNGKIPTLISNSDFAVYLANAVYFKAAWQNEFPIERTENDTFTDANGKKQAIDFMNDTASYRYFSSNGVEAAVLPYKTFARYEKDGTEVYSHSNQDLCMVVIKGKNDIENVSKIAQNAILSPSTRLNIKMPKFELKFEMPLNDILKSLGIKAMFTDNADFSKMINQNIFITNSVQKTYIKVDEKGTEAAAVTGFAGAATSLVPEDKPIDFFLDEPFSYVIMSGKTGEFLFIGRYAYAE